MASRTLDVITERSIEGAGLCYVDELNAWSQADDEVVAEKDKSHHHLDIINW